MIVKYAVLLALLALSTNIVDGGCHCSIRIHRQVKVFMN